MTETTVNLNVQINGVDYIRADSVPAAKPDGNRSVVVVERGRRSK